MCLCIGMTVLKYPLYYQEGLMIFIFQYINELRLEQAYRDLMNTDLSILHVAMNHGFPNEKSFIRVFKKGYGVTPHQYRKARKGSFVIKDEN